MTDFYHDDPIEEPVVKRATPKALFGSVLLLFAGPGGGTVYYVDYSGFSSPGAPCGTSCKYLEYAPKNWSGSSTDPGYQWSSNTSTFAVDIRNTFDEIAQRGLNTGNTAIGAGYMNTRNMLTTNATTGYTADTSEAAYRVSQYAGPKGTSGQGLLMLKRKPPPRN